MEIEILTLWTYSYHLHFVHIVIYSLVRIQVNLIYIVLKFIERKLLTSFESYSTKLVSSSCLHWYLKQLFFILWYTTFIRSFTFWSYKSFDCKLDLESNHISLFYYLVSITEKAYIVCIEPIHPPSWLLIGPTHSISWSSHMIELSCGWSHTKYIT